MGNKILDISQKPSKFYYQLLVNMKCEPPNLAHWKTVIPRDVEIPSIDIIMQQKVMTIKENKLAEFNYKLLCGIVSCGMLVNKWKPDISSTCKFCNENETQYHIVYLCPLVSDIWRCLSEKTQRNLTIVDIALGIPQERNLNNLISQIAFSIHKYWIIHTNDHVIASKRNLKYLIFHDLMFKSKVMKAIEEKELSDLMFNSANWIQETIT